MPHYAIKNQTLYKSIVGNEKMQFFVTLKRHKEINAKATKPTNSTKTANFSKIKLKNLANFVTQQGLGMKHTTYIITLGPGNSKIITL